MVVLKIELALHQEAWDVARQLVDALERLASEDAEYPWRWALGRVERYRSLLAEAK